MKHLYATLLFSILFLVSCAPKDTLQNVEIEIAFTTWPGYEFLYLAQQKGFFSEVGLNVKMLPVSSLADVQRAYIQGNANGMASTVIEALQAMHIGGRSLKFILIPDFSNGGDVIISPKSINSIQDLKGKPVGAEMSSLGIFVLQRALAKHGLQLEDVKPVNIEQSMGKKALDNGDVMGFVTYAPTSIEILRSDQYHTIFTSADIPYEIIDILALESELIDKHPSIVPKIHQAWQMALTYSKENPDEAYRMMAERQGVSTEEFKEVLQEIRVLDESEQRKMFTDGVQLKKNVQNVCETLIFVESLEGVSCEKFSDVVYTGPIIE